MKGYNPLDRNSQRGDDDETIDEALDQHRRREPWHVGRDIPLALIITIVLQTMAAVWWASGLSAKLDRAVEQIQEFKMDRYTKEDGRRDQALIMQMMESFRQTDRELERRVINCERHSDDERQGNGVRAR